MWFVILSLNKFSTHLTLWLLTSEFAIRKDLFATLFTTSFTYR
jgi:hypothetical protein